MSGGILNALVAIAFISAPWILVIGGALWMLAKTPIGRSLVRRSSLREDLEGRLQILEEEVTRLNQALQEVQERQDFTERYLARPAEEVHAPQPRRAPL